MRSTLRAWARSKGYVWFRKPDLPWGVDLQSDLQRCFDLDAFACVFDVGAHVGIMSRQFAQMFPRAQVFAFEMVPSTFGELKRNVDGIGRIHPHCVGLSDESSSRAITIEPDSPRNSLRNRVAPAAGDKVVLSTLVRIRAYVMVRTRIWSEAFMRQRLGVFRAKRLIDEGGVCLAALQGGQTARDGAAVGAVQPDPS